MRRFLRHHRHIEPLPKPGSLLLIAHAFSALARKRWALFCGGDRNHAGAPPRPGPLVPGSEVAVHLAELRPGRAPK
jgi:hypothetical protein